MSILRKGFLFASKFFAVNCLVRDRAVLFFLGKSGVKIDNNNKYNKLFVFISAWRWFFFIRSLIHFSCHLLVYTTRYFSLVRFFPFTKFFFPLMSIFCSFTKFFSSYVKFFFLLRAFLCYYVHFLNSLDVNFFSPSLDCIWYHIYYLCECCVSVRETNLPDYPVQRSPWFCQHAKACSKGVWAFLGAYHLSKPWLVFLDSFLFPFSLVWSLP